MRAAPSGAVSTGHRRLNSRNRLFHCGFYSQVGRIYQDSICRHFGRGVFARLVPLIANAQLLDHRFKGEVASLTAKFLPASRTAHFHAGVYPELRICFRRDDRSDIPAIEQGTQRLGCKSPLQFEESLANFRNRRHHACCLAGLSCAKVGLVEIGKIQAAGNRCDAICIIQCNPGTHRGNTGRAVQSPRIHVRQAVMGR